MKRRKYYSSLRSYHKIFLTHCIILSEGSIMYANDLGVTHNIDERDLIDEFESYTINVNRSTWPYHSIYSPEYIAKEKYKYE